VGSNPAREHECISMFLSVVLSPVYRGLSMDISPVQDVLPQCLKRLLVSEVIS